MNARSLVAPLFVAGTVLSFFGCKESSTASSTTTEPPAFQPGTVEQKNAPPNYPAGPYGVGEGSIMPDMAFIGYANAVASTTSMQIIHFSDFYNPHGRDKTYMPASPDQDDRLFPAGSQYGAGTPKPTVIAVDVASVWCGPCNAEAQCVLPVHERTYTPCGGGFFLQLQDGTDYGVPATPQALEIWAGKKYKEAFPTAIDPGERIINTVATQEAFPVNVLMDTTTMKIAKIVPGVPDSSYWKLYESMLADPSCPSKQPKCASDADCTAFKGTTCSTTCPQGAITCLAGACQAAGCKNQ